MCHVFLFHRHRRKGKIQLLLFSGSLYHGKKKEGARNSNSKNVSHFPPRTLRNEPSDDSDWKNHLTKPKQNASPLPNPNRFPFVNVITVSSQLRPKPRVVLDFCHHLLLCNIQPISGFFLFHLRMTSILTVHFDHPRPNHH